VMNDWLRVPHSPLAGDALSFFTCLCTGKVLQKRINPVQCCSSGWSEKFPSKRLLVVETVRLFRNLKH
jgi:hypothetical protein